MATLLGNRVKDNMKLTDEIIANNMLASGAVSADAYMKATLATATPELRAIFESSMGQILGGHSQLVELAISRGWETPYLSPAEQLSQSYKKAQRQIKG